MKFHGKAEQCAERIITAFQSPATLPGALAPIFIHRSEDIPCRKWSFGNQLLTAFAGHNDARGFRQWQSVRRHVKKGEKSFPILSPCTTKVDDPKSGEQKIIVVGFRSTAVFGLSQTEGEPLPDTDPEATAHLANLPFRDVAESWDLRIADYNGMPGQALGKYYHGQAITLGVRNLSTWAHEMCHAADDRNGTLKDSDKTSREIVAELGGAILLAAIGRDYDADLGGCWEYIRHYADSAQKAPITVCQSLLNRTCNAVRLILDTADSLASVAV